MHNKILVCNNAVDLDIFCVMKLMIMTWQMFMLKDFAVLNIPYHHNCHEYKKTLLYNEL